MQKMWSDTDKHAGAGANELLRSLLRGIECHSVLDTESSPFLWIPASAGMTTTAASCGE